MKLFLVIIYYNIFFFYLLMIIFFLESFDFNFIEMVWNELKRCVVREVLRIK